METEFLLILVSLSVFSNIHSFIEQSIQVVVTTLHQNLRGIIKRSAVSVIMWTCSKVATHLLPDPVVTDILGVKFFSSLSLTSIFFFWSLEWSGADVMTHQQLSWALSVLETE